MDRIAALEARIRALEARLDALASEPRGIAPEAVYTLKEAAPLLGVGKSTLYKLIASGDIPYVAVGLGKKGVKVVKGKDLLAYLDANRSGGMPSRGTFKYLKM